jgi:hypothetical protein
MEEGGLDQVLVDVAGEIVEISRRDRGALLQELCVVAGCGSIRKTFETSGERSPVRLDREQQLRLRPALEAWEREGLPPPGIASLLAALVRAESGGRRP